MALEAHVMLDGTDDVVSYNRLGDAIDKLNEASFAGIGGVAVIAVGRTAEMARGRIAGFMDDGQAETP